MPKRPRRSGRSPKRAYQKPVLLKLDMNAGAVPWARFAGDKGPRSNRGMHLVAAAWLHEHAHFETITPVHVFACYTSVGWSFDVSDPTGTLRALKQEGLGTLRGGRFRINPHGLAEAQKLAPGS